MHNTRCAGSILNGCYQRCQMLVITEPTLGSISVWCVMWLWSESRADILRAGTHKHTAKACTHTHTQDRHTHMAGTHTHRAHTHRAHTHTHRAGTHTRVRRMWWPSCWDFYFSINVCTDILIMFSAMMFTCWRCCISARWKSGDPTNYDFLVGSVLSNYRRWAKTSSINPSQTWTIINF